MKLVLKLECKQEWINHTTEAELALLNKKEKEKLYYLKISSNIIGGQINQVV